MEKRLAAILISDIVGYTKLMEEDTEGTVIAWSEARDNVVDPQVEALWDVVEATECSQLKPLFDPSNEAEAALHALETARPRWVLGQMLACAATTAVEGAPASRSAAHDKSRAAGHRG